MQDAQIAEIRTRSETLSVKKGFAILAPAK
jgi:hypothetical protein